MFFQQPYEVCLKGPWNEIAFEFGRLYRLNLLAILSVPPLTVCSFFNKKSSIENTIPFKLTLLEYWL